MHSVKCSHDPEATIATAPEEAARRMQLHWHWLQVKRWRKRKSRAERGTCRLGKGAPDKFSLDEVAEGGLANNHYGPPSSTCSFTLSYQRVVYASFLLQNRFVKVL